MRNLKFAFAFAGALLLAATSAIAQSSPGLTKGQVLTAGQWNGLFAGKQDTLGYTPLNLAGGVLTGRLVTAPPGSTTSGLNLAPGSAPAAPVNGDIWTTAAGLFVRINGSTLGPLGTLACPTCVVNNATNTFTAYQVVNLNVTAAPSPQTGTVLQISQADTVASRIEQSAFGNGAFYTGIRSNGTNAAPTTLINGDSIASFNGWGYDGTSRTGPAGALRVFAGGTWSNTSHPTYIDFATTGIGSTTLTSRMVIYLDGGITIGGTTSQGLGTLNVLSSIYNNGTAPVGAGGGYVLSNAPALVSPTANTLALGGAAVGGNALAVTGTAAFSSSVTAASNILVGATSGNMTLLCAAVCGSSQITLPNGITNFSATGGANQVLMQTSAGGALTVAQLGFSGLSGNIGAGQFATGPGIVTFSMLNNAAAATVAGNPTAGSTVRTDFTIDGLTDITTPHATLDWLLIKNHTTGTLQKTNASELLASGGAGVTSLNTLSGVLTLLPSPQGRLTLQTGTPVMSTSQSAKAQIFYTCAGGASVPYYTGTADAVDAIASCEVSLTMVSGATAGQTVNNNVYDVWWVHGGANRICIAMSASTGGGGGWSSDGGSNTARGTGYSQLDFLFRPYITNKNSITNCFNGATNYGPVSANQATWVGTTYTTANGQTSYKFGTNAASGQNALFGLYNAYNRVSVATQLRDTTANWAYAVATFRQANNSTSNQIQVVDGLGTSSIAAQYAVDVTISGSSASLGVGVDSTSVQSGRGGFVGISGDVFTSYRGTVGAGLHTFVPLEAGGGAGTVTWFGGASGEMQFEATIGGL